MSQSLACSATATTATASGVAVVCGLQLFAAETIAPMDNLQLVLEGKDRIIEGKDRIIEGKDRELAAKDREHALALQLAAARERELAREAAALRRELDALRCSTGSVQSAVAAALQDERARLAREETLARFQRDQRALWLRSTEGLAAGFTIVAQCGFDLDAVPSCCRALRGDAALWEAIKDARSGPKRRTRLHYAAWACDLARVRFLLSCGCDVNCLDGDHCTPLLYGESHLEVVTELIRKGADVNIPEGDGETILMRSCIRGDIEMLRMLLSNGAHIDQVDDNGQPALMIAIEFDDGAALVQELCARGASVDLRSEGATALMIAALNGRIDHARILLAHGASKTAVNEEGENAYAHAEGQSAELLALLKP